MAPIYPKYIDGLPAKKRDAARMRFAVRLAALYATEDGGIKHLSARLGLHPNSLATLLAPARGNVVMPHRIAKAIEQLVGREIVPREALNPEVYGDDNTQSE